MLPYTGHDQLWLLLAAQRMLAAHSVNPYGPTVFESNPPLVIWLSTLVVKLSSFLHLSLTVTFKLTVILIAAAIAAICVPLLRRLSPELTPAARIFLLAVFLLAFGAIPVRDFGQRDHVLALLILPYLLLAALSLKEQTRVPQVPPLKPGFIPPILLRITVTLLAALGLALKPHQALIPIAVESTLLLYPRLRRGRILEPTLFLFAAATYFAAIHSVASTYLTEVVPILRQTYWSFGRLNLFQLQAESIPLHVLALTTLGSFVYRLRTRPATIPPIEPILLSAGLAALLAYIAQGTGWYYHQIPAITLFSLTLAFQLIAFTTHKPLQPPRWLPIATIGLTILTLTLATHFSHFSRTPQGFRQPQPTPDPTLFAGLPPGAAVATITTSVDHTVEPAFLYNLTLAQRYPHLWILPAILRNQSGPTPKRIIPPARLAELAALQRRFMVEDLTRWQPQIILVALCQDPANHCQALEDRHDDLLAFFLADPAFASIFAHYRYQHTIGSYAAYLRVEN